jgi:folate-binding protein YgfZ
VQNLVTANVEALRPGDWTRACMLTAKGRVVAVLDIVARQHALLALCEPAIADKALAYFEQHAIMDDVGFALRRGPMHRVWASPAEVWDAPPVFAPCPAPIAPAAAVEARRIEAGVPRYGVDVSEDYFPFESRLRETIDYRKGCYLGQEPVARVNAQGQAKRSLLGLELAGDGPVAPGTAVDHADRAGVGVVTSSAVSPELGPIALAYLGREAWSVGTGVRVGDRVATVCALPFTAVGGPEDDPASCE